jgi:hypothetical protein
MASQLTNERHGYATAPHLQVDYGALPDVHLHAVAAGARARAHRHHALRTGNVELGLNYRFVHEAIRTPQIATFPLILLRPATIGPARATRACSSRSGSRRRSGDGRRTEAAATGATRGRQCELHAGELARPAQPREAPTVGTELFYQTKRTVDGDPRLAFNVGATVKLTDAPPPRIRGTRRSVETTRSPDTSRTGGRSAGASTPGSSCGRPPPAALPDRARGCAQLQDRIAQGAIAGHT